MLQWSPIPAHHERQPHRNTVAHRLIENMAEHAADIPKIARFK
jgi:hypothetical protein